MDVAFATNGISGVLERLGRDEEALVAMERAHALAVEAKGGNEADPAVVRARKNLEGLRSHVKRKAARAAADTNAKPEL